ncbi:MFS transporter [Solibacillus sp. FSL W7-1472]|uniref:Permease of the major facilitator superfamily n=2 Tax=Solibacillus TaxID=648800 RepID=F2F826_SOLSS|nr:MULTISPECIES: MFS transporter [Solibacillus]AMO84517.1 multidrug transporter [Solibacillus silvestris]EKB47045.1 Metal-tetracycline/H(+) antiporter [Solibacillus isronensis B3W22]OBW58695.1 multidrug transporter [Solibacillus silvestris]BAK17591.1 permease of the major facilitator superfamily [Solibacillus silvestris StLB046]
MTEKSNKLALYLLMFNMFITMGGIGIIVPVMPSYLQVFGVGGQVLGFLVAGFALAQFLFSPIAGDLSDRHGRKMFIICGLIVYGSAQILFGLASEVWILFLARFLSGTGAAFIMAPIMAFVADITTYEERGKGMGMIGAAMSLGFMVGPGIGGFLAEVNLTFPFYLAGVVAYIAAILSAIYLPNIKNVREVIAPREKLARQLAKSVKTSYFVFLIIVFTFSFGISNFQATLTLYLDHKFGYSPSEIAIILTVGGFAGVVLQMFVVNKLFKRFGEMKVILVNLLLAAAMMLLVIYISGFFIILVVATLFSIATTFIRPAVNTLISKLAGNEQGFAAGMNNAYMSLGNMFGPALAGVLFDWNPDSPYILGTCVLVGCFMLAYSWTVKKAPHLMKAAS